MEKTVEEIVEEKIEEEIEEIEEVEAIILEETPKE